jgi:hypothetical protein
MHRWIRSLCGLALFFALTACGPSVDPAKLTKIVISGNGNPAGRFGFPWSEPAGSPWQVGLQANNTYFFSSDCNRSNGPLAFAPFIKRMLDEHAIWHLPRMYGGRPALFFWFEEKGGAVETALPADGSDNPDLRGLAEIAYATVARADYRQRLPMLQRLSTLHGLRSVTVTTGGCLGFCGQYRLTVDSAGRALLHWSYPRAPDARGTIPWRDVELLLHTAGVASLEQNYCFHMTDARSSRIDFDFGDATFSSTASDTAAPPVAAILRGFDALIKRTAWTPPLAGPQVRQLR